MALVSTILNLSNRQKFVLKGSLHTERTTAFWNIKLCLNFSDLQIMLSCVSLEKLWKESLVLLQVLNCFVPVKILWASTKIWLHLVPHQKLLCWHKKQFYWMQIIFLSSTKCLWLPQYVNKFLVWHKKFGPAQNILGLVKGQGIRK